MKPSIIVSSSDDEGSISPEPVLNELTTSSISTKTMDSSTPAYRDDPEEVDQPVPEAVFDTPLANLSWPARLLLWLGFPVTFITLLFVLPRAGFAIPILALPTISALWWRTRLPSAEQTDLETLLWTFFLSGTVGFAVVGLIQTALLYVFATMLFATHTDDFFKEFGRSSVTGLAPDELDRRFAMARSWKYGMLILFFSFPVAAFWEELLKYTAVITVHKRRKEIKPREYIDYIVAAALGFSTSESIGYSYSSAASDELGMFVVTVAERVIFGTLLHCLAAVLTGTRMIRRDVRGEKLSIWQVLSPAVLYHGLFNTCVLGVCAFDGNVGWIHPREPISVTLLLLLILSLSAMLIFQARAATADCSFGRPNRYSDTR